MDAMLNKSFEVNDLGRGCSQWVNDGHILTFGQESGWSGRCDEMTSGHALNSHCRARRALPAVPPRTAGALSKALSGSCVPADLPEELGHWQRTYVRFSRWREKGVWERMATALQGDADMEHLSIDSTIVRAHQHSAGAQKSGATGNRPLAGRADDQGARRCGCLGQSAAHHPLGQPSRRYRTGHRADSGAVGRVHRG